jgi:4'-phosphopantetheinyl transferase
MQDIASRFFCPEEAAEISSLPVNEHERAFFSCWTRKEAYLKATGDGLSTPLDQFRVTLKPTEPAKFVHFRQDTREAEKWTLHDLRLTSGYAAALAYRDRPRRLQVFPTIDSAEFMRLP